MASVAQLVYITRNECRAMVVCVINKYYYLCIMASVAQLVEQWVVVPLVAGSIPVGRPIIIWRWSQWDIEIFFIEKYDYHNKAIALSKKNLILPIGLLF